MNILDFNYYLELQNRLIDISSYVTISADNLNTYSIKIENLIVDSGAFFDSLIQSYIFFLIQEEVLEVENEPRLSKFYEDRNAQSLNMNDYKQHVLIPRSFRDKEVNLNINVDAPYNIHGGNYFEDRPDDFIVKPFENLESNSDSILWWKSYTKLKHDRILHHSKATLKILIDALTSVFILLTYKYEKEFRKGAIDKDIFKVFFPLHMTPNGSRIKGIPMFKHPS